MFVIQFGVILCHVVVACQSAWSTTSSIWTSHEILICGCVCFLSESTKAAVHMLSEIGVEVLEFIVVNELCEFKGREKLDDTGMIISSLVKTESVDAIGWWRGVVGNAFRPKRRYSTPGRVSTAMGDCLSAGKSSQC